MEPDFIATIKLTTGEELISKVSYMPDDDSLVLENPMRVGPIDNVQRNVRVNGFVLTEWIHSTFDHMFVLPKSHVLTMTEVEDEKIQHFYTDCVQKHITQLDMYICAQYVKIHIYIHIYTYAYVRTYVRTYVRMHACIHACMHA